MVEADVIVVGAGLAGLVAARDLVRAGVRVVVLEARDRVGGRTLSTELDGQTVDLGGQWIGDAHEKLRALARELGVETFPQYARGKKVLERDGVRETFSGFLPRLPLLSLGELGITLLKLERAAKGIPLDAPLTAEHASEWDHITLADWLDRNVKRAPARQMIELAAQMIFAKEASELSFLFFLLYVRSSEGLRRLANIEDGAQERRFTTGAQSVCTRLAAPLGERVKLEHAVHAIDQDDLGVTVHARRFAATDGALADTGSVRSADDGIALSAKRVIVAAPPAVLAKIGFSPALPRERARIHEAMPAGSVIKCIASYARPFWREAGYSGEAFSPHGLVRATFDDCSADGGHAALVAFVVGDSARTLADRPEAERRQLVLAELGRLHGKEAHAPLSYLDKNWLADEWSGGCYVGALAPGILSEVAAALRAPVGRVHFAGTETAVHHLGYLEGAVESGERAAREVIAAA